MAHFGRELGYRLREAGVLVGAGREVDVEFYASRMGASREDTSAALEELVDAGELTAETRWECHECAATTAVSQSTCVDCEATRSIEASETRVFLRRVETDQRDPSAVFLIHGMNTLGDWQQSFAWKIQLLYGYSIPIFVFKFGRDRLSPLTGWSQRNRSRALGNALRQARADLNNAGKNKRCDVIAHSFGVLMLTQLLQDNSFADLRFGRVVLTGSIAPVDFDWTPLVAGGRIEGVLNHRAGRDIWVRVAPWVFPNVGSSGYDGFRNQTYVEDCLSPDFSHSDFFQREQFDTVIRTNWIPFLHSRAVRGAPNASKPETEAKMNVAPRQGYWVGRCFLAVALFIAALAILEGAVVVGLTAQRDFPVVFGAGSVGKKP